MKRFNEQVQVKVGAFVAVGLFFLFLVIFLLGSEKNLFEHSYDLVCWFTDISGLRVGAPVQLAGINVGTVGKIHFDARLEKKQVKLTLGISSRFKERIREDSVATIVTQGLLGDRLVSISVGSPDKKILNNGDELPASSPTGFSELVDKGKELLDNANKSAENVNAILEEIRGGKGLIHGLVYDPEGEKLVSEAGKVAENLSEASANMEEILARIERGEGTLGALVNDPTLFDDMKTLLGKANRNKLIRAVIRETLRTREENLLKK